MNFEPGNKILVKFSDRDSPTYTTVCSREDIRDYWGDHPMINSMRVVWVWKEYVLGGRKPVVLNIESLPKQYSKKQKNLPEWW
jgi:hypothetical protein